MDITTQEAIKLVTGLKQEKITQEQMGMALGVTKQNISQTKNKILSQEQIDKIENYFNVNLTDVKSNKDENEIIKIPYIDWLPEEMRNPKYSYVPAQRMSLDDWSADIDSLRIVAMNGDKMEFFWYRIRNKDVLLVDTSERKVNNNGSGVYFATSRGKTKFWIREMTETIDDGIEFKAYAPSGITTRVLTRQQLEDADFQIIGRVIKNVSLTI